ncbi:MAG: hypothetical protein ACLRQF_13180 [Thomasclavelia ramosa]
MFKEGIERTDWDWLIYPQGLYDMIVQLKINILTIKQFISQKMEWDIRMNLLE